MNQVTLAQRLKPSRGGALAVLGLLVFGLVILGGLYLSPKGFAPAAPPDIPPGVPMQKLRFVAYDLARQHPSNDPMFVQLAKLKADYVLLQDVSEDDAVEITETLGLQKSFHPQLYQRSEHLTGPKGTSGNLILSRQTLYAGGPLGGKRGGYGGWAISVVDGNEFCVANLHTSPGDQAGAEAANFEQAWKERGSPPIVAVVLPTESTPPSGMNFLTAVPTPGGESFFVSKDWKVTASGTAEVAGTGLVPRWIEVTRAENLAATQRAP